MAEGIPHLVERLNHLFETVPQPGGGGPYTSISMVAALADRGIEVTSAQIRSMRTGRRTNPSAALLAGVADVFGVPIDYFFDEARARQVDDELAGLVALRELKAVRLRGQLDPVSLIEVVTAIAKLQAIEEGESS